MTFYNDPFVLFTDLSLAGTWSSLGGTTFAVDPTLVDTTFTGDFEAYTTSAEYNDFDSNNVMEDASNLAAASQNTVFILAGTQPGSTGSSGAYVTHAEGFFNSTLHFDDGSSYTVYMCTRTLSNGDTYLDLLDGDLSVMYGYLETNDVELVGVTLGTFDAYDYNGFYPTGFDLADTGVDEYMLLTNATAGSLTSGDIFNVDGLSTGGTYVAETTTGTTADLNNNGLIDEGSAESSVASSATLTGSGGATLVNVSGFSSSTVTLTNGTVLNLYVAVREYSDGTVALDFFDDLMRDPNILELAVIESIQLGTLDTFDYTGFYSNSFDEPLVVCFTKGTLIRTENGDVLIEDLTSGTCVETVTGEMQPVRWVGSTVLSERMLEQKPQLRPVRIKAGALGPNTPETDLCVSPQHRVLLRSDIVGRMFGSEEVLVPAIKLLDLDGVDQIDAGKTEYFHILMDKHEVIWANGAPAETLFNGPQAAVMLSDEARVEISEIMPQFFDVATATFGHKARLVSKKSKIAHLVHRHSKNGKPLYTAH
ncbi:Hint domain-containing protein [Palleronia caenipelagi]|uniref:Hint domain-containing protein n=1 Tax=Palleronia caenipelagi TaxID=2489174 RepID=A0A547PQ62_9RHOB|nr:Hint domain-containing protein [Palleronia caenipelagi]TRD16260.1 Hint domain-containing protein [Palleronia caenipelagi]